MGRLTKDALLAASDLVEREVDLPAIGGSVKVRSLPAAFSNQASSEALTLKTVGREQVASVDTAKLEVIQILHALIEPKLDSMEEAETFAKRCGPSFKEVIRVIDDISGVDKESLENARATFPVSGKKKVGSDLGDGTGPGNGRSDVPARASTGAGQERA